MTELLVLSSCIVGAILYEHFNRKPKPPEISEPTRSFRGAHRESKSQDSYNN
jgi:hypothetical protein